MHSGMTLHASFTPNAYTLNFQFCVLAEVLHDRGSDTCNAFAKLQYFSNTFYTHKLSQSSLDWFKKNKIKILYPWVLEIPSTDSS